jgi:hypothetical protein
MCLGWSLAASEMVSWPNPRYVAPKTVSRREVSSRVTEMAARVAPTTTVQSQVDAARAGAESASRRWTEAERALVYATLCEVASQKKRFTSDDVWHALGDEVPMTMGLAALLRRAQKNGHIRPTSEHAYSQRADRKDHDYGRHLRVWESTEVV